MNDDLISRQDAIDALNDEFTIVGKTNATVVQDYIRRVNNRLHDLPSAQPERKRGKWIDPTREGCVLYDKHAYAECSACGKKAYLGWRMRYCPNCGAQMEEEYD